MSSSSLNTFGRTSQQGEFDTLDVTGDETVGGNLDVAGTVTASQFSGGGLTPTFLLPNGSAADPALAFSSSTSSGIYWDTAGTSGQAWSSNGTKRLKLTDTKFEVDVPVDAGTNSLTSGSVSVTGTLRGSVGDQTAPTFSWNGHTTGGMFWNPSISGPGISSQSTEIANFGTSGATFSEVVKIINGSTAIPGLGFSSDPGLGFRRVGLGDMAITYNNNDSFDFSDTLGFNTYGRGITAGTGAISGAGITGSSLSLGTGPATVGALSSTSLTSSGNVSCGTNSLTCGAITSSGTFSNGSNAMTCGALTSTSVFTSGKVTNSVGSQAAPSYTFNGATTSGMYFDAGTTQARLTISGTDRLTVSPTSVVCGALAPTSISVGSGTISTSGACTVGALTSTSVTSSGTMSGTTVSASTAFRSADGSAGTPSLSFTNSTNSGLFYGSSGVHVSTAGVERALFDVNGLTMASTGGIVLNGEGASGYLVLDAGKSIESIVAATSYTPTIGDGTHNFTGGTNTGGYYRLGPLVIVFGSVSWTGKGSAVAGSALAISLPVACSASFYGMCNISYNLGVGFVGNYLSGFPVISTSAMNFVGITSTTSTATPTAVLISNCDTSGSVNFTAVYTT